MSKRIDNRTMIAVAVTLLLIAGGAIFFGWKISDLSRTGWAGFAYFFQVKQEKILEKVPLMAAFLKPAGEVAITVPGGPADRAGIRLGDRIQSVDGIPIGDLEKLVQFADKVEPGESVEYTFDRDGATMTVNVELDGATGSRSQMIGLTASLITGFGFLLISILLYTAGPRSQGATLFFQLCVVGSMFFFFSAAFEFDMNDARGIVPAGSQAGVILTLGGYLVLNLLMMSLLLHFSLVFPRRNKILERTPSTRSWLHLAPFAIPISLALTVFILDLSAKRFAAVLLTSLALIVIAALIRLNQKRRALGGWKSAIVASPLTSLGLLSTLILAAHAVSIWLISGPAFLIVFILFFVLAFFGSFVWAMAYLLMTVGNFYRSYRESNFEERRQLRWPLWGTIVSLLSITMLAILFIVGLFMKPPLHITNPVLMSSLGSVVKLGFLLIPISFGLGIQKYGLMQVDTILKKTFVYGAVTTFVVITYLVVVGVFGVALVSWAGVENQSVTVAATLIVAALFIPVRNRVQTFVDTRFFKRQQDYDEVRRSLARLTATSRDLEQFLTIATRTLVDALGVQRLGIFVREPSGSSLVLQRAHGLPEQVADRFEIPAGDPVTQPGNAVIDLEGHTSLIGPALGARFAMRLQSADGVIGAVVVSDRLRDPLSEEDLEFLRSIVDQLALGISSLQIRTDDLEVVQARQIQRSLLPAEIPQIKGVRIATAWIPARSVGGDYYDVLSLSGSKLGFCIGDVVGKGMPAALLMSGLQSAVRAIAPADSGTDITVAGVRRVAAQNLSGGKFITFFYGTIDSSRRIEYTNAGHNEPILVRSDGSVTHLSTPGAAIARIMSEVELSSESLQIGRGDTIVLFTDGVTEAPRKETNDPEDIYGEERLVALVSAHRSREPEDLIGTILDDVREFSGGEFSDDLTMVIVRAE